MVQRPSRHDCPAPQEVPHAPQFAGSMRVSAHAAVTPLPQSESGDAHESAHEPIEQRLPAGHALPHIPQLAASVASDTQRPAHTVCPTGHERVHAPAAQTCPGPQTVPQAPQLLVSLWRSRHDVPHTV